MWQLDHVDVDLLDKVSRLYRGWARYSSCREARNFVKTSVQRMLFGPDVQGPKCGFWMGGCPEDGLDEEDGDLLGVDVCVSFQSEQSQKSCGPIGISFRKPN